jgi:hypothetical protein
MRWVVPPRARETVPLVKQCNIAYPRPPKFSRLRVKECKLVTEAVHQNQPKPPTTTFSYGQTTGQNANISDAAATHSTLDWASLTRRKFSIRLFARTPRFHAAGESHRLKSTYSPNRVVVQLGQERYRKGGKADCPRDAPVRACSMPRCTRTLLHL